MKKQKSYEIAFSIAVEKIKKVPIRDLIHKIKLSGGKILDINDDNSVFTFELQFFNHIYNISFPDFNFSSETEKVISLVTRIIILHYIEKINTNLQLSGELVSYKYIPGAFNYYPVFSKKAIVPILKEQPDIKKLKNVAEKIEANEVKMGDYSFEVNVFPKIKITVIFYEGDEDFESSLDFLFDSTIKDILSLEDIVVISQMLSKRIIFHLKG